MFLDECKKQLEISIATLGGRMVTEAACQIGHGPNRLYLSTYLQEKDFLARMSKAAHYWLDVAQAQQFQGSHFPKLSLPNLPHQHMFIEFNGLITFNYVIPVVSPIWEEEGIAAKQNTPYRGVLISRSDPPHFWTNFPNEPVYQATWFEPPRESLTRPGVTTSDLYGISWCGSSWPNLIADTNKTIAEEKQDFIDMANRAAAGMAVAGGEQGQVDADGNILHTPIADSLVGVRRDDHHARRLFRMTVNLLYFLSAENQTVIRVRPEHHNKGITRGLPKSTAPYYILPIQHQRYRYLIKESATGTGTKHGHRYDVSGHFRHLTSDRYERNVDGTVRVLWISPHQRGLSNLEYKAALHTGKIAQQVLECDDFVRRVEDRIRRRRGG